MKKEEKKVVTWYIADGENTTMDLIENIDEGRRRSKSWNQQKPRPRIMHSRSSASRQPVSSPVVKANIGVAVMLEGALTRRRSETRKHQFNTRLLDAIPGGDNAYMNRLLAMGANPNATCLLNHVSACHIAALYNNDALELLVNAGAVTSRCDQQGSTPLHIAAWAGNLNQIALLLDFPAGLRKSVMNDLTPETLQEVKKHSVLVNQLINTPCQLNLVASIPETWRDGLEHNCRNIKEMLPLFQQGWTALHAASARAQHQCVQLLIAAGADVCAQDILCSTPLAVVGCAHYSGYKIEESNFSETVKLLLEAGGKLRGYSSINTPLHTAVELGSERAVENLLQGNASAKVWNNQGLTAMHICVKKRNNQLLQLLANYEYSDKHPYESAVNTKDEYGNTILSAAVREGWTQGVCIALSAGACITLKENGETAIHIAAELGNVNILQEILNVAKSSYAIDYCNERGETALLKAIIHKQFEAVKLLLKAGAKIEVKLPNNANVLHVAAEHGDKDILEYLLDYDKNITDKIINAFDNNGPPLLYAVGKNHPECVKLLISRGAIVKNSEFKNEDGKTIPITLLHIAARKNHYEIAEIIIENDNSTIHEIGFGDELPLHEACYHGNREMISLLLKKGADLSGASKTKKCETKLTPIAILMNNLSKPTEFMEEVFDSYISSQGMSLQDSNCKVEVDYNVLVPHGTDKQMRVINAIVNTGTTYDQARLLLHPLVQSFLYLKWKALLPFFYSILMLYIVFVLSLNMYAFSIFYYRDRNKEVPPFLNSEIWVYLIYLSVCLIAIQEIVFIKIKNKRHLRCLETWVKFCAISLAMFLPPTVSWDTELVWARHIATIALLLSWFEMMFLISRLPDWGYYVLMFGKVANKVLKILLSFIFLIFGFSICFMIQYHAKPPFEGPWAAFVKTVVMMTTEYDYQSNINRTDVTKITASIITLRILFLAFLIIVSIILMNLMVGVAVNDVNNLEIIGNMKRLEKQIEIITSHEDVISNKLIKRILPRRMYRRWILNSNWDNILVLQPRIATCCNSSRFPIRIREAIFEKAQLKKKQSDEEQGSKMFKMKLDEIYNVVVNKDSGPVPELSVTVINKIVEEIKKIRDDINLMKKMLPNNKRRTLISNNSII